MSQAERFALAGALILLLLHGLVMLVPDASVALEYRRAMLAAEPWRSVTGHLIHINVAHAVINAAAWFVVARLFARELRAASQAVVIIVAMATISVALAWHYPAIDWYRGFSGVLHALFFAGSTAWLAQSLGQRAQRTVAALWLPCALTAGGWAKVLWEQPAGTETPLAAWLGAPTVPQAHLIGALCGTFCGAVIAWRRWRDSAAPARLRENCE